MFAFVLDASKKRGLTEHICSLNSNYTSSLLFFAALDSNLCFLSLPKTCLDLRRTYVYYV